MNIRNFSIIAHIDHGKSTLADRLLEVTKTVEARKMKDQMLDSMELERERGITIKMTPVRMNYHSDRRSDADGTRNDAEKNTNTELLYEDLSYKIRGILFVVRKNLGLGHKEQIYHSAIEIELKKAGINFESKKNIQIIYDGKNIGTYQPDFIIDNKILIELKALPEIGRPQEEQIWSYLKGCEYKLALLVNFGSKDLEIKRVIYDIAREFSGSIPRTSALSPSVSAGVSNQGEDYVLNLIDTPGHIDFSYEVSRSLRAVEGTLLLVDSTQGVQAQTLTTLEMAKEINLKIIPVITKIDSPLADTEKTKDEIVKLLNCDRSEILSVSGKTGEGVKELIEEIILRVPAPDDNKQTNNSSRALIFDFEYSNHQGVILYVRILDGKMKAGNDLLFLQAKHRFIIRELGTLNPEKRETKEISAGEIGYIVTGIKEPGIARVGDTVTTFAHPLFAFPGYKEPTPIVFASIYPETQDEFDDLRSSLSKLKLSDSSLTFEEESSGALGRGFRCGFLGMLHLEIVTERLRREFDQELVITSPSITYEVTLKNGEIEMVYTPIHFPDHGAYISVREPWIIMTIITPSAYMSPLMQLFHNHEASIISMSDFSEDRIEIIVDMPLRELMRNFFDEVKGATSGYASISYKTGEMKKAEVTRLDVYVAEERVAAFSRVIPEYRTNEESEQVVEKLEKILPQEMFRVKIQAYVRGKIIASRSIAPQKKDVTGHLYGGDISRKMKLRDKQKEGKKRMQREGKVNISHDTFLSIMKS